MFTDDNECVNGVSNCDYQCNNNPGTFNCTCGAGYSGTENDCTGRHVVLYIS